MSLFCIQEDKNANCLNWFRAGPFPIHFHYKNLIKSLIYIMGAFSLKLQAKVTFMGENKMDLLQGMQAMVEPRIYLSWGN